MPALKDHIGQPTVSALAHELAAAWRGFPEARFVTEASTGLEDLELKARIRRVATALQQALPEDPQALVDVLDAALQSRSFDGWLVWPVADLLTLLGAEHAEVVLPFMARLTHRSSCEFAIRPCIEERPELTFAYLREWVTHPDDHVRRLVSEGTRPRLPWGPRLRALQQDPSPAIALLDGLRDDPSAYVRRSVANHLGDILKDHPELAIATAQRWKAEGGDHVDAVIRHGLRTLIKTGDPAALRLVGYDVDAAVRLTEVTVEPAQLAIGGHAYLAVDLVTDDPGPVPIVVEYVIHYLGPRGPRKPKAYRLAERTLAPGVVCRLQRKQTFAHASIRTLHPGDHLIEIQVNGQVLGSCNLDLTAQPARDDGAGAPAT